MRRLLTAIRITQIFFTKSPFPHYPKNKSNSMKPRRIYRNVVTASLLALALGLGGCVVGASSYYPGPGPLENDFWFYPSVGVYYDNQRGYYHYNSGGTWVETTVLPSYLYSGLGTYVVLDNPGPRPWYYYNNHRRYYPAERYRHYPPNPPPRYGHRPRWDDDRRPGDRPPPSGGRTPPGYYRPGGDDVRPGYRPPGDNTVWPGSRPPGEDRPPPGQAPRPTPRPQPQPWRLGDDPGFGDGPRTNELPRSQGPGQAYPPRPVGNQPSPRPQPMPQPRNEPPRNGPGGSPLGPYTPPAGRPGGSVPPGKPRLPPPSSGDTSSEPGSGPFGVQGGPSPGTSSRPRSGPLAEY